MILSSLLLVCVLAFAVQAQDADYDIYLEFRKWVQSLPNDQRGSRDQQIRRYSEKLAGEAIDAAEIRRRAGLPRGQADKFEAEYWNRGLTTGRFAAGKPSRT